MPSSASCPAPDALGASKPKPAGARNPARLALPSASSAAPPAKVETTATGEGEGRVEGVEEGVGEGEGVALGEGGTHAPPCPPGLTTRTRPKSMPMNSVPLAASTAMLERGRKGAAKAGPPSPTLPAIPGHPPEPAAVVMSVPLAFTRRARLLLESAINRLSQASSAMPVGQLRRAERGGPPSPPYPAVPTALPASREIMPVLAFTLETAWRSRMYRCALLSSARAAGPGLLDRQPAVAGPPSPGGHAESPQTPAYTVTPPPTRSRRRTTRAPRSRT